MNSIENQAVATAEATTSQAQAPVQTTTPPVASKPEARFYIAFSRHGDSGPFIIAKGSQSQRDALAGKVTETKGRSSAANRDKRSKSYDASFGTKIVWDGLSNTKTHEPLRDMTTILKKFDQLQAAGWTIERREEFKAAK